MGRKSKRGKSETGVKRLFKSVFSRAKTADSRLEMTAEEPPSENVEELIKVRIEPDSKEIQSQSLLSARDITTNIFTIGRRDGKVGQAPSNSTFSIRQIEPYTVSRQHCALELHPEFVLVSDLGSQYGTLVNGTRIGGRNKEQSTIKIERGTHALLLGPRNSTIRFKLIVQ
ncbi:MAG: FHA domain-containing protein [Opitutaceae bacterium]